MTNRDIDDLIEGFKERKRKKWKEPPKVSKKDQVIQLYMDTQDMDQIAREMKIKKSAVAAILEEVGML